MQGAQLHPAFQLLGFAVENALRDRDGDRQKTAD